MSRGDAETEEQFYARLPATRGAAGALLLDAAGRVLLVECTYRPNQPRGLPGGVIEKDESPLAACVREVQEELGVRPVISQLAAVDWLAPAPPRTAATMFTFVGRLPADAQIRLAPDELCGWAWVEQADLPARLAPHITRRVVAALEAYATGRTVYLENGTAPLTRHGF